MRVTTDELRTFAFWRLSLAFWLRCRYFNTFSNKNQEKTVGKNSPQRTQRPEFIHHSESPLQAEGNKAGKKYHKEFCVLKFESSHLIFAGGERKHAFTHDPRKRINYRNLARHVLSQSEGSHQKIQN